MFNTVVPAIPYPCPKCGEKIKSDWQSKNVQLRGYYLENDLSEIPILTDIDADIHAICEHCKEFVEYTIEKGRIKKDE